MSGFVVRGLDPAPFVPLYGLSDAALAERNIVRRTADAVPGFPCRVTLEDAAVGSTLLLLNWEHLPVASPYRSAHAIYVREGAETAAEYHDEVPTQLRRRLLSVRGYDAEGMMIAADVFAGEALAARIEAFFADPAIEYLHVHNAKPGCFAARINRA
jgi:hypothetical protein